MCEVLIAGLGPQLASEIARSLADVSVKFLATPADAAERVQSADLLILDDNFSEETVQFLAEMRTDSPDLPVIYCLDAAADARIVRKLLLDLSVRELVFHPADPEMLARQVASIVGVPYSGPRDSGSGSAPEDPLARKLGEVWGRVRSKMIDRVEILDYAAAACLAGKLDPVLRKRARSEAHKLAGSLGTFGLPAGSRFARELERTLEAEMRVTEAQALRFVEVVAALRVEVERWSGSPASSVGNAASDAALRPGIVVSADAEWAAALTEAALARGWPFHSVRDANAAREALPGVEPEVVLIDVDADTAGTLNLLSELAARTRPVPAIILTSGGTLMDRVEVARRGGRGFFLKSLPPGEIIDTVRSLLDRLRPCAHVLAVDDDPTVLDALSVLLSSHGIRLTTLNEPLGLWEKLEGSLPDLVILDIEMPRVSGIELCRVIRGDLRWAATPVIFLTALSGADTVRRVFAAGADDFVAKPIVGPELVARICNRLERTRLLRNMADVDGPTGVPNRVKCRQALTDFLRLADRHGQPMSLALLGIDGLGRVNKEYGPRTGDDVLRDVSRYLLEEFHSEEVVGRWGGNHFAVGLYGLDRVACLRRLQRFLDTFAGRKFAAQPVLAGSSDFTVTLSGGIAGYPEDASDLEGLLLAAGEARQRARAAGGNQLHTAVSEPGGLRRADLVVVSGDEPTMTLLVHGIESAGYCSRVLRSGATAARTLYGKERALQARLLLIDADLPGLDSLQLIERLASEGTLNQTTVVVLSSASGGIGAAQALATGAADLIAKPVDFPVLLDLVRLQLESRQTPGVTGSHCLRQDLSIH